MFVDARTRLDAPAAHHWTHVLLKVLALLNLAFEEYAWAYEHPLSSTSLRKAYFLGQRSDQRVKDFLEQYIKHLPMPEQGPYISTISVFTPYARAVLSSRQSGLGFSAQQAESQHASQEETVEVKIRIEFTATYNAMQGTKPDENVAGEQDLVMRPQDFWRDFRFEVSQKGKQIKPRNIQGAPIYGRGFRGAEVSLQYNTKEVASEETLVVVVTPDNRRVTTTFDLASLR